MMVNDPVGDMITRIRNAHIRKRPNVSTPGSKLRERILDVLKQEGYIRGYAVEPSPNGQTRIEIELKYFNGEPVIRDIARVSKPGRRVYRSVDDLPRVANGLGIAILSTSRGVMSEHEAREQNVGGEVLCRVF
jgi:small subunit ribosomal protein S8